MSTPDRFAELPAPAHWRAVDVIADLHLQAAEPATAQAFLDWLAGPAAEQTDALFILGDLFEVWIGDDVLDAAPDVCPESVFLRRCADALSRLARTVPVHFMVGNRDFLFGHAAACRCGMTLLSDPTVLIWDERRWLLSHGDALCLADTDYQRFRHEVRSPAWQARFLAQPLPARDAQARALRAASEARKRQLGHDPSLWADVDGDEAQRWLGRADAPVLIHGHTHRPARHVLPDGGERWVLSDWDLQARPPRGEILRLTPGAPPRRLPLR
jgi:UDP-2,3-diacylglucosamine hydrolase